jgi:PEGA domain
MKRSLLIAVLLSLPLSVFAAKDPSNYPLKVYIFQVAWGSHNVRYNEYRATGRGNVWEGESVHAFDFTYDCSFPVRRPARNQPYLAKWKKTQVRLDLLANKIGTNDKYEECQLQTTVRTGVYVVSEGSISEVSQEEFKNVKGQRDAKAQNAAAVPSGISKVSVASAPDGAEIEVDGEFMGNTPSVLELDPGEHSIAVRKTGYKAWEKKLKLTAGEIKLNAELEAEGSKKDGSK